MSKIPKIIVQTWKNSQIPEHWKTSIPSIRREMPDWEHHFLTDFDCRNLVALNFPDFLPYFDKFEYNIQRADAIRYMFLYLYGGLYLDMDYEMQHSMEPLFNSGYDIYLVQGPNVPKYVTNSIMASAPGNPFWLEVINEMKIPNNSFTRHFKVLNTTGPLMLSRILKKVGYKYNYIILPKSNIAPCNVCNDCVCPEANPDNYLKQLRGNSWTGIETQVYNFIFCNRLAIIVLIFTIISLVAGFSILVRRKGKINWNLL